MDFLKLGPASELDSPDPQIRSFLGKKIGIWRDESGTWRAMEMICRHQNGDLSLGERDGDIVTCPRHGWRYDLSTGACLTESWARLRPYAIREESGVLYLSSRPVESPEI